MITELHPSFYQIIRKHRFDSDVSNDDFIGALTTALNRSVDKILECGHGINNLDNNVCLVCLTKSDTSYDT